MKLTSTTLLSVDGVMQGPGGSDEDRREGFERGGWALGNRDEEVGAFIGELYGRADAFLFGRWTFDLFAGYWGPLGDSGPIAAALNTRPKYVASNTMTDPPWTDTTVLAGDVAAAVRELKARPGGELQVHGSGVLLRFLLENALVDEMNLIIVPVLVGHGARLFPASGPDTALELLESRAFPRGTTLQVHRPAGRPRYAPGSAD